MNKKTLTCAIALIALSGCGDEQEEAKKAWMDKQREKFIYALKDPESAKFRNEFLMRDALCGEVNAKNSMGGYTGFKRFISHPKWIEVEEDGEENRTNFAKTWEQNCT